MVQSLLTIDHFMHDLGPFPPPAHVTFFMFVHDQLLLQQNYYYLLGIRLRHRVLWLGQAREPSGAAMG